MILCIRTDSPEAQFFLYDLKGVEVASVIKVLGREMEKQFLNCLEELLQQKKMSWSNLSGVVVFQGPGSFTGLRIGATAANAIASSEQVPIIASRGEDWINNGIKRFLAGENDRTALPFYDREANITTQKK